MCNSVIVFLLPLISILSPVCCCSDSPIEQFIVELANEIFPLNHINLIYDIEMDSNNDPCRSDLFARILGDKPDGVGLQNSVTLFNPYEINSSNVENLLYTQQRFIEWAWVNILIFDSRIQGFDFNIFTNMPVKRAKEYFLRDYNVLWASKGNNLDYHYILHPQLQYLKYKVELRIEDLKIQIYSICFYCQNGESALLKLIERKEKVKIRKNEIFPDFSRNFGGRRLRLVGGAGIPLLMNFKKIHNEWKPWGGFMIDPILFHTQLKMNFTVTTRVFKVFGSQLENGSFTGMVDELYNGRADIGIAGQSYDRIQGIHFLNPIHIDSVSFATALPYSGVKWQAVFKAFKLDTWLTFIALCFGTTLPCYIWFSDGKHGNNATFRSRLTNGLAFIYRPIVDQDLTGSVIPTSDSGRILMIFWLSTLLILGVAYKSKLTSLMVHPETEDALNDFESLARSKYSIILHHVGGALHKNILTTPSSTFKKIGKRLKLESSMYKCLQKTKESKSTACISYIHNIIGETYRNFTNANEESSLRVAGTNVFMTAGSYMIPKSAIYRESMNEIVAWEVGIGFGKLALDKAFKKPLDEGKSWARQRPELYTSNQSENGPQPLKMNHLIAPLLILFIGLFVSGWCFGTERVKGHLCYSIS